MRCEHILLASSHGSSICRSIPVVVGIAIDGDTVGRDFYLVQILKDELVAFFLVLDAI